MKELVIGILMWLSANSPLQWDGKDAPDVIQVPPSVLADIYYDGKIPKVISQEQEDFTVEAIYSWSTNRVYVRDSIDLTSLIGKSALAHELVHYLQYRHGIDRQVACVKELEPLAYEFQTKYFFKHGGKQIQMDPMALLIASTCL